MEEEKVLLYKGLECKIIWNYGNGKCEILLFSEIILVDESELIEV